MSAGVITAVGIDVSKYKKAQWLPEDPAVK